jgi:hypothetical protein
VSTTVAKWFVPIARGTMNKICRFGRLEVHNTLRPGEYMSVVTRGLSGSRAQRVYVGG